MNNEELVRIRENVFRVKSSSNERYEILKYFPKDDPAFEKEREGLEALKGQGAPTVYNVKRSEDRNCIRMEYIPGTTLEEAILKNSLSNSQKRKVILELIDLLKKCHEKGIIHGDVTPFNIILDPDNGVHLIDFGGGYTPGISETPEHKKGVIGPPTDIFAIGHICELLLGKNFGCKKTLHKRPNISTLRKRVQGRAGMRVLLAAFVVSVLGFGAWVNPWNKIAPLFETHGARQASTQLKSATVDPSEKAFGDAWAKYELGYLPEAEQLSYEILESKPTRSLAARSTYLLGMITKKYSQLEISRRYFYEAIELYGNQRKSAFTAKIQLATLEIQQGDIETGRTILTSLKVHPEWLDKKRAQIQRTWMYYYLELGNYEKALEHCRQALALMEGSVERELDLLRSQGLILMYLGEDAGYDISNDAQTRSLSLGNEERYYYALLNSALWNCRTGINNSPYVQAIKAFSERHGNKELVNELGKILKRCEKLSQESGSDPPDPEDIPPQEKSGSDPPDPEDIPPQERSGSDPPDEEDVPPHGKSGSDPPDEEDVPPDFETRYTILWEEYKEGARAYALIRKDLLHLQTIIPADSNFDSLRGKINFAIGMTRKKEGYYPKALQDFKKAAEFDNNSVRFLAPLEAARAYRLMGNLEQAGVMLERAAGNAYDGMPKQYELALVRGRHILARETDVALALPLAIEQLEVARECNDQMRIADALLDLGISQILWGATADGEAATMEAQEIVLDRGDQTKYYYSLVNLAAASYAKGGTGEPYSSMVRAHARKHHDHDLLKDLEWTMEQLRPAPQPGNDTPTEEHR